MHINFSVVSPGVEEYDSARFFPEHLPLMNAKLKAEAVAADYPGHLILGADTVVELDGAIIEKPADSISALEMLMMLSGREHQVVTAVCLTCLKKGLSVIFTEKSRVLFKKFDRQTAEEYMSRVYVLDKAGAYAVQEHGDMVIRQITGSESNVIGLPSEKLEEALNAAGFMI